MSAQTPAKSNQTETAPLTGEERHYNGMDVKGPALLTMPVAREEAQLSIQAVETGRVRIVKRIHEEEQLIHRSLLREEVDVQRVSVEQLVDQIPQIREEGDLLIVPVVEEVLVIEKRLMLKEELHIRKKQIAEPFSQQVRVRVEEAVVERIPTQGAGQPVPDREHE